MNDFAHPSRRSLLFLALVLVLALGFVGQMDYEDAKLIEAEKAAGRYLPAPGNRTKCDKTYLAGQADGSSAPVKVRCTYSSRVVWL